MRAACADPTVPCQEPKKRLVVFRENELGPEMNRFMGLVIIIAMLSGCATTKIVDTRNPLNIRAALKEGDRITLTTRDYLHYEFRVLSLADEGLSGKGEEGQPILIPYVEIRSLEVRVPRPGRTAGAVAGGIVGSVVAVYALAIGAVLVILGGIHGY
jgi:hypothetical protein